MSRIRIKNFGPIKDGLVNADGWIDFRKVTVFIGNQGSGKSTLAKIFSTFSWMEKALVRGDYDKKWFERKGRLRNPLLSYHRLENYIDAQESKSTVIEYEGEAYRLLYENGQLQCTAISEARYFVPQIMYVPAERNFISYVKKPSELKLSSYSLKEFLTEFENAKDWIKGPVSLPINNTELEYDKLNDTLNLRGSAYKLRLTDASSGFQSLVPLYLVSDYLSASIKEISETNRDSMSAEEIQRFKKGVENIFNNATLTEEQKRVALSVLSSKFNKTSFLNIVEEPEQNLFPSSQWQILKSLLKFNNRTKANALVITTHSPYLVSFLSIAVQAFELSQKLSNMPGHTDKLETLKQVINPESMLAGQDLAIYQMDESNGTIATLPVFNGIPSDKNLLNGYLIQSNEMFDSLLEIEEGL